MQVVLLSPDNATIDVQMVRKANGFYGIRFVPYTAGTYFCQILDPHGTPTSVRPFEVQVTEAEVSKTPRKLLSVSPRERVAIRSHSESAYRSPREQKILKEKQSTGVMTPSVNSPPEETAPSTPDQLMLEIKCEDGTGIPGKAFQIPVIGEEAGAYFVQFRTGFHSGKFTLQVFSQFGVPLFEEKPLAIYIQHKFQICLISLNLPLTANDLDLEVIPVKAPFGVTPTPMTVQTPTGIRKRLGGSVETLPEGFLVVLFDDPTKEHQHLTHQHDHKPDSSRKIKRDRPYLKHNNLKIARFQLWYNNFQLFTDNYIITI